MEKIGQTIGRLRKEHHVTQTQLAEYLFVTPQTVSKWEAGNGTPDISLLPRIASFFEISLDELFGITKLEQLEDMVSRYSVLRDEESFQKTLYSLELGIQAAEGKDGNRDELIKLLALRAHLYLQNLWSSLEKANVSVNRANELLKDDVENEWYPRFLLQKFQFRLIKGEYRAVRDESRAYFESKPCRETLYLYLEVLNMLEDYEGIIQLMETDEKVNKLLGKSPSEDVKIRMVHVLAKLSLDQVDTAKQDAERMVFPFCSKEQKLGIMMSMEAAARRKEKINGSRDVDCSGRDDFERKKMLYDLLEQCSFNEYIKLGIRKQIDDL